jgi:hypothetical protein
MAGALCCIDGIRRISSHTANGICTTGKYHNSKDSGNWSNVGQFHEWYLRLLKLNPTFAQRSGATSVPCLTEMTYHVGLVIVGRGDIALCSSLARLSEPFCTLSSAWRVMSVEKQKSARRAKKGGGWSRWILPCALRTVHATVSSYNAVPVDNRRH